MADATRSIMQYMEQVGKADEAREKTQAVIKDLVARHGNVDFKSCSESERATAAKLAYLKLSLEQYRTFLDLIHSKVALLTTKGTRLSADEVGVVDAATQVFASMEAGLERVLQVPENACTRMLKRCKTIIQEWPMLFAGTSFAGGACGGAAVVHYLSGNTILTVLGGGAGVIAALAVVLITFLVQEYLCDKNELVDDEVAARKRIEEMMKSMEKAALTVQEMRRLGDLVDQTFGKPELVPEEDDECSICLNKFEEGQKTHTRAPNCQVHHFMHQTCWAEWLARGNPAKCLTCGQ